MEASKAPPLPTHRTHAHKHAHMSITDGSDPLGALPSNAPLSHVAHALWEAVFGPWEGCGAFLDILRKVGDVVGHPPRDGETLPERVAMIRERLRRLQT